MSFLNVEIKAKCAQPDPIRKYLHEHNARFLGTDEQTDTYFNVEKGRLKLREGKIENALIYYERDDEAGPKNSHFSLIRVEDPKALKSVLTKSIGIKIIVKKLREIYYINNVKFHIDEVPDLGSFIEIEAGNILAELNAAQLREQCDFYLKEFGIENGDLLKGSYSDLLMEKLLAKNNGS